MSKQFERLYHAWVLEFRERYLRWADPRARPWEHSCRKHDGSCGTPDDQMVMCDHCDSMYGFKCADPPLKKLPKKAWHCPDCKPKLKSVKGIRMLSAVAENAAHKRAELGDLPKKKIKQTMYLVKWAGLGYEFCTWETRQDINDDALIAEFHRLNNALPDESDMTDEVVDKVLSTTKHINVENAGGISCIPSLRAQLYAQTRAFHFSKFGVEIPELVCSECGPKTKASSTDPALTTHPREVVECLADLVSKTERKQFADPIRNNTSLPPPMTGEYDTIIPITSRGLMLNVGETSGSVAFLGYRTFENGRKGPAELGRLIRGSGDKIIAVDGVSTIGLQFKEVIEMLRQSGKNKFCYMRFLENRFSSCDAQCLSTGTIGRYAIEELGKKFTSDRKRMIVHRTRQLMDEVEDEQAEKDDDDEDSDVAENEDSDDESSEGEFQPDSGDEDADLIAESKTVDNSPSKDDVSKPEPPAAPRAEPSQNVNASAYQSESAMDPPAETGPKPGAICKQETTRSLAYRLLDMDVGYSSDEGGDEDRAYFLDGVDGTFTTMEELSDSVPPKEVKSKKRKEAKKVAPVPARLNEFSTMGDRAKLSSAVALTTKPPAREDFDRFPLPSTKEIEAVAKAEEVQAQHSPSPVKGKKSTVKIEQISVATGEVLHVWANVESAAATLQLPLPQLRQVLRGEYDEDIGDEVGGYKWNYALVGAKVTAGTETSGRGGGGKKAQEAWLEFRDKLYDPSEPHMYKNNNRLRDYQVDGVNWLASTWYKRQGCILSDEMVR